MTIECYHSDCPYHGVHEPEGEGPFCYEDECRATEEQLKEYDDARRKYLEEHTHTIPFERRSK